MPDASPGNSNVQPTSNRDHGAGGVRVIVTGQVGLDKARFLDRVVKISKSCGHDVKLFNVGELMTAEAPDIVSQRILDLPRQRLTALRRSVFKDILQLAARGENLIVNTHATFRWKHGLFHAYDHNQVADLNPHLYVTLVDDVDAVHERLQREHEIDHTLKDILVWREEEIVVTEAMAEAIAGYGRALVLSRSNADINAQSFYRLMFEPDRKRVYPSFPMTHMLDLPDMLNRIEQFRRTLAEHFITFDPGDLDEKRLLFVAGEATKQGLNSVTVEVNGTQVAMSVREITEVAKDIDAQIYARDFKLIEQSDMIVSYIPTMADGRPGLSSGVERELQHAFECTKEVYVIWDSVQEPSPFITETATRVFRSIDDLLSYCRDQNYISNRPLSAPTHGS